jgi:hypothetical protein|nr:MAG TPA: hypothetical protein [Caudoviricetes sp.]
MERFVRLNEVQYADTEAQRDTLIASGFVPAPLPEESADKKDADDKGKGEEEQVKAVRDGAGKRSTAD